MPPSTKIQHNLITDWTIQILRLAYLLAMLVEIASSQPRRKSENGWRPPLPPQNLTLLTSGVDSSTGKAWIQIGWQPPPEQISNGSDRPRLPVNRYRITWHHRPSHTGALNDENEDDQQQNLNDDELHHHSDASLNEAEEETSSTPPNSKLRAASSMHELRKMVHKHQTSFTVDSLEPGEVYTVYLQAFGERDSVKLRSVRISRKFRAPLLPPDYKSKTTKSLINPVDDEEYEEENDDEDEENHEEAQSSQQLSGHQKETAVLSSSSSSASVFASILIGTPYYEYGFLKLNVSWQFDASLPSSSTTVPVLLKWRPEVCLEQQQSSQTPTFQRLQSQSNNDQSRKSPGTSSAVAFGASYIVTGLRFACRYSLSLEPKFDTAQYNNAATSSLPSESNFQSARVTTHKRRRHSSRQPHTPGLDSRTFTSSIRNEKSLSRSRRGERGRRSLSAVFPRRRRNREVVKHFETPSCSEVKVVGDVEPPCLLQALHSTDLSSFFSPPSSSSLSKNSPEFHQIQFASNRNAAIAAAVQPPPPPRDFSCQLTMPSLQPSPTSATCWWREPVIPSSSTSGLQDEFHSVRALRLRSSWRNNSSSNSFDTGEEEPEMLKSRVVGYKLWHALVDHASDLELARAGKRKRRREAPVYMKLLTQDELSFTLASLKPGQTYVVELQTVIAPVAPNALPQRSAQQHQLMSAPVRRIIHVPVASPSSINSDDIRLAALADDARAFERYGINTRQTDGRSGAGRQNSVLIVIVAGLLLTFFETIGRRRQRRCS